MELRKALVAGVVECLPLVCKSTHARDLGSAVLAACGSRGVLGVGVPSLELEGRLNEFDSTGRVVPYQFRRHVDSVDAVGEEPRVAYGVSILFGSVLLAIDFDRELGLRAPEVRDVPVDKGPVPELEASKPPAAKDAPKASLRRAGSAAEPASLSRLARRRVATGHCAHSRGVTY